MSGTTWRRHARASAAAVTAGALVLGLATPASATVSPATATVTVPAGNSAVVPAGVTVQVPAIAQKLDIEIAIDTTGSMCGEIAQAQAQATDLVNTVAAAVPDVNFAVVDFKDSFDAVEYVVRTPMTGSAANVATAINAMSCGGGGDTPEAFNLVFDRAADPAVGGDLGWRAASRRIVVVIGDAPPHGANAAPYAACNDFSADPHGLSTATELAELAAAQRTLFMVASWEGILPCYEALASTGFSGSDAVMLSTDLADQVLALVSDASANVETVTLSVASASPAPAAASWITTSPTSAGPLATPATVNFGVTVAVPAGTPGGTYAFDLVGLADGGDVGHLALTVIVPSSTRTTTRLVANPVVLTVGPGIKVVIGQLSARLTSDTGAAVPGKTLTFRAKNGTVLCNATTDADGTARCNNLGAWLYGVLLLGYDVGFAGDTTHAPASATGAVIVVAGKKLL